MADIWVRQLAWAAGDVSEIAADVGPPVSALKGGYETAPLGSLRIGFALLSSRIQEEVVVPPEPWIASLEVGAQGVRIEPIDLPCVLNVELPVRAHVRPLRAPASARLVIVSATEGPTIHHALGATRFAVLMNGDIVTIPQWCEALTVYAGGALTLLDPLGIPSGTITGPDYLVPRHRYAVSIQATADSHVVFHYTT